MVQSLRSGVLGLGAHQSAMDIEGNNIANVNTVGFKYSRANFSEMMNQTMRSASQPSSNLGGTNPTQVGMGAGVESSTRIFKQGAIQSTDRDTDLAISGDGFFVLGDRGSSNCVGCGNHLYSRAGDFGFDGVGYLTNPAGYIVQGWMADTEGDFELNPTGSVGNIQIDKSLTAPAKATEIINVAGNLDSSEDLQCLFDLEEGQTVNIGGTEYTYTNTSPATSPQFNSFNELRAIIGNNATVENGKLKLPEGTTVAITGGTNPNSELVSALSGLSSTGVSSKVAPSYAMTIDVCDSLGESHTITFDFYKSGDNSWAIQTKTDGQATLEGADANGILNGSVTFNEDGSIATLDINGAGAQTLNLNPNNQSAQPQDIALNFGSKFDGLTGLARDYETLDISHNGNTSGTLSDIQVDSNGVVIGTFSNGMKKNLAQVAIAKFENNEGLESEGSNLFSATSNSNQAVLGAARTAGRGAIASSSLEMSNVDLGKSLTELIVIQRGYQANSKTITTSDTMLDTLMQVKR